MILLVKGFVSRDGVLSPERGFCSFFHRLNSFRTWSKIPLGNCSCPSPVRALCLWDREVLLSPELPLLLHAGQSIDTLPSSHSPSRSLENSLKRSNTLLLGVSQLPNFRPHIPHESARLYRWVLLNRRCPSLRLYVVEHGFTEGTTEAF